MGCPECNSEDYEWGDEYESILKDLTWESYVCNKCHCEWRITVTRVVIKHGNKR